MVDFFAESLANPAIPKLFWMPWWSWESNGLRLRSVLKASGNYLRHEGSPYSVMEVLKRRGKTSNRQEGTRSLRIMVKVWHLKGLTYRPSPIHFYTLMLCWCCTQLHSSVACQCPYMEHWHPTLSLYTPGTGNFNQFQRSYNDYIFIPLLWHIVSQLYVDLL